MVMSCTSFYDININYHQRVSGFLYSYLAAIHNPALFGALSLTTVNQKTCFATLQGFPGSSFIRFQCFIYAGRSS